MERGKGAGDRIGVADMEPSERYPLYTRGNTGEVFPHALSALGGTLMGDDVGRAQMEVFREIGFVTPRDLEGIMLGTGVFGGYLYRSGRGRTRSRLRANTTIAPACSAARSVPKSESFETTTNS